MFFWKKSDRNILKRYKLIDNKALIEIKLNTFSQLFDEKDPAPFINKDLDDDAAAYLFNSYQEFPHNIEFKISILIPERESQDPRIQTIENAIHSYFSHEAEFANVEIKRTLKVGAKSLVIGIIFLILAVVASKLFSIGKPGVVGLFFKEGLMLLGWVSMWKPVNIFLYEWWPLLENRNDFYELSRSEIEIKFY